MYGKLCLILWFYAELRLDLFKKTLSLPQVSMGFLQKKSSASATLKARRIMKALQKVGTHQTQLALIEYSLKAKAVDFSKVHAQKFVVLFDLLEVGSSIVISFVAAHC